MNTYDNLNRTRTITWTGAGENFSEAISFNSQTGNIDQITRELGTFTYNHDQTDQLTGISYTGTTQLPAELVNRTINYDYAGNRSSDTLNGTTKSHANVILENDKFKILPDEDGLGRIWQKVSKTENKTDIFDYQTDGKPIWFRRYENGTLTRDVSYYWDALNRRVAKKFKINNQTWTNTFAFLGLNWQILFAQNGQGDQEFFSDGLGIDEHLGKINSSGAFAFTTDHLGTVTNDEAVGEKKTTSPWGEPLGQDLVLSTSSAPVRYGFTGRPVEVESVCQDNRWRIFCSDIGTFTSEDQRGYDLNSPRYAMNRPTLIVDSMGLAPGDIFSSMNEVGADALNNTNARSISENREYGAWIYGSPQTGYTYTEPVQGSATGILASQMPPMPYGTVGDFHTHGADTPGYFNERFSSSDIKSNMEFNTTGFLGTPSGNLLRYDPFGSFSEPRMCK